MLSQKRPKSVNLTDTQVDSLLGMIRESKAIDSIVTWGVILKNGSRLIWGCIDLVMIDDVFIETDRKDEIISEIRKVRNKVDKNSPWYTKIRKMLGE